MAVSLLILAKHPFSSLAAKAGSSAGLPTSQLSGGDNKTLKMGVLVQRMNRLDHNYAFAEMIPASKSYRGRMASDLARSRETRTSLLVVWFSTFLCAPPVLDDWWWTSLLGRCCHPALQSRRTARLSLLVILRHRGKHTRKNWRGWFLEDQGRLGHGHSCVWTAPCSPVNK